MAYRLEVTCDQTGVGDQCGRPEVPSFWGKNPGENGEFVCFLGESVSERQQVTIFLGKTVVKPSCAHLCC
jgi:hypothetical protein